MSLSSYFFTQLNGFKYFYQIQTILFFCQKLNGFKYFYQIQTILFFCPKLNGFKYFYVTVTIEHQSSVCTCSIAIKNKRITLSFTKIYLSLFLLKGIEVSLMWERQMDGGSRMETATLTNTFSFLLAILYCVFFKASLSISSASWLGALNWTFTVGSCPRRATRRAPSHMLALSTTNCISSGCKLRLTEAHSAHIWHGHLHISFHNTHTFPFNPMTPSAYFHRCVLCWESLIDDSARVNIQHFSPPFFPKCLPMDIFLTSLSISPNTHTLQRMFKDSNSKNTTIITHLRRRPFQHAIITPF